MPEEEKNQPQEETEPETAKTGAISGDDVGEEYIERVEGYEQYVFKKVKTIVFEGVPIKNANDEFECKFNRKTCKKVY